MEDVPDRIGEPRKPGLVFILIFGLLTQTNINKARLDSCELLLVIVTEILKKRLTLGIRITDLRTSPKFER